MSPYIQDMETEENVLCMPQEDTKNENIIKEDIHETKKCTQNEKNLSIDSKRRSNCSYISLIANAILASPEKRLVLSDIYDYVTKNFKQFDINNNGWKNSIRHNLSLNDCFVKAGRSPNGKGHFWCIHPSNYHDFVKGDFRRRRLQRAAHNLFKTSFYNEKDIFPTHAKTYKSSIPKFESLESNVLPLAHHQTLGNCINVKISTNSLYLNNYKAIHSPTKTISKPKTKFDIESILKL